MTDVRDEGVPEEAPHEVEDEQPVTRSHLRFMVCGIGASAGGLPALIRMFEVMPGKTGMAFVVVLHLSPKHDSNAASVLAKSTRLVVEQVTEQVPLEVDHVYVIPPNRSLTMSDGQLILGKPARKGAGPVVIDQFFRTLALAHHERAVGIVLSGMGSDGAIGLARIKELGGVTFAQAPDDAEYESMPRAAIESQMVDFVLPVTDMPQQLIDLWSVTRRIRLPATADMPDVLVPETLDEGVTAEQALRDTIKLLHQRTGHDFQYYKRATALRRIERRMQVNGITDLPTYRDFLEASQIEASLLLQDMLIGVTNFFRDREAFEALERSALMPMFDKRDAPTEVRAWVAGCSTGEEAYSMAMLLSERASSLKHPVAIQVFATDIDRNSLATARDGRYPESIVIDVPPSRLREFFKLEDGRYQVIKSLREKVLFAEHNLLRDPPFSKLDLISCRNLLIYLERGIQEKILEIFRFALKPGGYLMLGSSESADAVSHFFRPVDKKNRIYRAIETAGSAIRYTPALPLGLRTERPVTAATLVEQPPKFSLERLHQRLVKQYAPPSIIVDADGDIAYLSERAGRFLRYAAGEPSHNLILAVDPELRLDLRSALFQAAHSRKSTEARRVPIRRDGQIFYVTMLVRPILESDAPPNLMLVVLDEVEATLSPGSDGHQTAHDPVVDQLEGELLRTKEQLQTTIEQYETSNEELKASNEELQAINEELRSATEELETSKEELQSVNEELTTVNHELKVKVDETVKANDDLSNLIASTDIATIFIDRGMRIKRYTPPASRIFNIIATDIDRSLFDITHRLHYDQLAEDAGLAFGSLRSIEREVESSDGHWYLVRAQPYRTSEDVIDGAVLTFVDISTRRRAEQQMRESEARLRLLFQHTLDYAVMTFDRNGRIETWNSGAEQVFGYSEQEAVGQDVSLIFTPEDRKSGVPEIEMRTARDEGRAIDERWHLRKDGVRVFCSGVMTPIRDGRLLGYAKIARDATDRKSLEQRQMELLTKEQFERVGAQNANRIKDEFLAVMSHELKNPLNVININAHLLSRLPEAGIGTETARFADTIRRAVTSQARIIDDLLDLSRLNTGKLQLAVGPVDLTAMLEAAAAAAHQLAESKGLTVVRELASESMVVQADETRLEQMIWNLLSNAIKFTPQGGTITLRQSWCGAMACVEVIDTGFGIDAAVLPNLFEMFWQADGKSTRRFGGLGIGLSIVRQLAELHGGSVSAHSAGVNLGSRFTLSLQLADTPVIESPVVMSRASRLAGLRILLVEDSVETLEAFRALLDSEGAEVTATDSPAQALDAAERIHFDVVISDIGMPDMSGYQFIAQLREMIGYEETPAIALSGFGFAKLTPAAADSRFNVHLAKPVSPGELLDAILAARAPADGSSPGP